MDEESEKTGMYTGTFPTKPLSPRRPASVKVAPYKFFVRARAAFENLAMAQAFKLHAKVARGITQ